MAYKTKTQDKGKIKPLSSPAPNTLPPSPPQAQPALADIPKQVQAVVYSYLALPVLIFCIGWMKIYIAVPLCVLIVFSLYRMIKASGSEIGTPGIHQEPKGESGRGKNANHSSVPLMNRFRCSMEGTYGRYAIAFGIIFFWVLISGVGKFAFQNGDHTTRNGIFELLVDNNWPVIIDSPHYDRPVGLIYYIGFWLPPAFVGKLFGMAAGYFAQAVWASIGIFLLYYIVTVKFAKKAALWPLSIIVFFSGLDIIGKYLMGEDILSILGNNREHIEWWIGSPYLQYSSMTTQLFWVFNQAVPIWLCTVVIITQKNNRYLALLFAFSMIQGVLPAIGIALLIVFFAIKNIALIVKGKPFAKSARPLVAEHLTVENCLGVAVALVFLIYYAGNFVSQNGSFRSWTSFGGIIIMVVFFFVVEAGVYLAAVAAYHKRNYLFYYVIAMLLFVCPWFIVGIYNDFCMRVSIPALVILMCLVIDTLTKAKKEKKRKIVAAIVILLVIGSYTPLNEIVRSVSLTIETEKSSMPQGIYSLNPIEVDSIRDQFYGYSDSFFFKYLAK